MSIQDAYESHKLIQPDTPSLIKSIAEITEKSPSGLTNWGPVPSATEIDFGEGSASAELGIFTRREKQVGAVEDVDRRLNEKPSYSQPITRKIGVFSQRHMLMRTAQRYLQQPQSHLNAP